MKNNDKPCFRFEKLCTSLNKLRVTVILVSNYLVPFSLASFFASRTFFVNVKSCCMPKRNHGQRFYVASLYLLQVELTGGN